ERVEANLRYLRHVGEHRWMVEVAGAVPALPAEQHTGTPVRRVVDETLHFGAGLVVDERPHVHVRLSTAPHPQPGHALREPPGELFRHPGLDVEAVGRGARLTDVPLGR